MHYAICIIAKDEAANIGQLISQLPMQTLLFQGAPVMIAVVCNGCTDDTAQVARAAIVGTEWQDGVEAQVYEFREPGKARTWNLAVHEIFDAKADIAIFIDADIELADGAVLLELVNELRGNEGAVAVSGWPVKDIARNGKKSLLDRFSLKVSAQNSFPHSINGSLYAANMEEIRRIWLPSPLPGEDGMLSAMILTEGFSRREQLERIRRVPRPTHYFEAHTIAGFFRHEQRMAIGTTINGWLCEHFWSGQHTNHVGELVRQRNSETPNWVDRLVARNVGQKFWALPSRLLTWRLYNLRNLGVAEFLARAPFSLAATILNIWPCILANRTLKRRASSSYW